MGYFPLGWPDIHSCHGNSCKLEGKRCSDDSLHFNLCRLPAYSPPLPQDRWALTAQKYLQNYTREHRVIPAVQLRPSLVRGMGDESDIVQDSMEPEDQLRS